MSVAIMGDVARESTGIDHLDEVLDGGIPAQASVLIIGPPGAGKTTLLNQFIYAGLVEDQTALYLALDTDPEEVTEDTAYSGFTFSEYEDRLIYIDGYSWREGEEITTEFGLEGPSDLNQMNMTLADAMRRAGDGRKRVGVDSVSTLALYTDSQSTVKFLQVLTAKSKAADASLMMTLEEGVHDEQTVSTLNYVADGVIRMKMEGDTRMLSVSRMEKTDHTREWMEFEITEENGIVITE